ncbi:MAG TPA: LCP family protein [Streptosporangiaceae bacterium]|nr:LCP family protein [Streptosporangiaceae bacterium]
MKILRWASVALAAVLVVGAAGSYVAIQLKLDAVTRIKKIDSTHRPPRYNNALNLLLLGSDTRSGRNRGIGGLGGCNCSDTIMLAHISPGRGKIVVVSIPRDTMVPYYACSPWNGLPGQQADPYGVERINQTLAFGGPECVRETVEQQTGVFIDNVIQLDFVGFQKVINDVGGVNVCVPFAIDNTISASGGSGLNLPAGEHHINGKVALQFWRTRENIANGSDIARIARDQYLMAQIVKGVLHSGLLNSPAKLYKVLGDVASSMTTDASDSDLLHIASSLSGISTANVQLITAPWVSYPGNANEVEFSQPEADALFWAIAHDTKLPEVPRQTGRKGRKTPNPAGQLLMVSPDQVKVEVLNGSDAADQAGSAATALTGRGFNVVGTGYAATTGYTESVIQYSAAAELPAVNTLEAQFSSVRIQRVAGLTPGTIQVILGADFTALAPPRPTSQTSISQLSSYYGGITANVSCRNSAFYGYYDSPPAGQVPCAC